MQNAANGCSEPNFTAVEYELFDATRDALIYGTLKMVISHPTDRFAQAAIETVIRTKKSESGTGAQRVALGFEIYTSENV